MKRTVETQKLVRSAMLIALATTLALICAQIPFLNLPFGGGFTVASMLPIILISYLYGMKWGLFSSLVYSFIQLALGAFTGGGYVISLFTLSSDDFLGYPQGVCIVLLDYIVAYTVLCTGGLFREHLKKLPALVLGTLTALTLRYLIHIFSGYIFFGTYAEWFFSQEGFYAFGEWILSNVSGGLLGILYSVIYNGLFMIPEIIITTAAAAAVAPLRMIRKGN